MAKILIGCRLPHGLTLTHPTLKAKVTLAGLNSSKIIGATHVTTEVEQEFWDAIKASHTDFAPIKSGAIFDARNETEALAKAKDRRKEKTGFEPTDPNAGGVKPAESK